MQNLAPLIGVQNAQFIVVTVRFSVCRVLHEHKRLVGSVSRTENSNASTVSLRSVGQFKAVPAEIRDVRSSVYSLCHGQSRAAEHHGLLFSRNAQQSLVAAILRVRYIKCDDNLVRENTHLLERIVERDETAIGERLLQCGREGFLQNLISIFKNLQRGPVVLNRLREEEERHDGVARVVWPFCVVSVGREEKIKLANESALLILFCPVEGFVNEVIIPQHEAEHASCSDRPCSMIVDAIMFAHVFNREEMRHGSEQPRLDELPISRCQPVVHAVVCLRNMNQPHGFVQRLPEYFSDSFTRTHRMVGQGRIQFRVAQEHITNERGVACIIRHGKQKTGELHLTIVLFVFFVSVSAGVFRNRNIDWSRQRLIELPFCLFIGSIKEGELAKTLFDEPRFTCGDDKIGPGLLRCDERVCNSQQRHRHQYPDLTSHMKYVPPLMSTDAPFTNDALSDAR